MTLYGFASTDERELFDLLTGVTGVGPKVGLAFLSALQPEALRRAVIAGDADTLTVVPGVGKKVAQRVVLDLRDKLGGEGADVISIGPLADVREALLRWGSRRPRPRRSWPGSIPRARRPTISFARPCRRWDDGRHAGNRRAQRPFDERLIEADALSPEDREFDVALRPHSRRLRGAGPGEGAAEGAPERREPAQRPGRSSPVQRAARARQDHPRADRRDRDGGGLPADDRPCAGAPLRPRGDPDQPRRRRRAVRRRDPPHAPGGRGGTLPGARGLQPRRGARQGPDRPLDPARPAPVHADRRDHATRTHHAAPARAVRVQPQARLLRGRGPHPHRVAQRRHPWGRDGRGGRRGDRPPLARHPAHREPAAAPGARRRRGAPRRGDHRRYRPGRAGDVRGRRAGARPSRSRDPARDHRAVLRRAGGLSTLAAAVGEEPDTVEDVVEPYLLQLGFLQRTPRGRVATPRAYAHLGVTAPGQLPL